jgi:hypothetical protein
VHTFLLYLLQLFQCLLPLPTLHMSQNHGSPSNHISRWRLVEHSQSTQNAPKFCIHVNQSFAHKDIRLPTTLNELYMNKHTIFKCS